MAASGFDPRKTLYVSSRKAWRDWLKKHYRSGKEVWLIYFKKESGKPRIPYNEAVEEALCFGWIDSTVRTIDNERFAQRFSPRKPNSPYSEANKARARKLIKQGKVAKDILPMLKGATRGKFKAPPDIVEAIKANTEAWRNFQKFSSSYKQIRVAFIDGARKRPQEFQKRLKHFIRMTEKNKQFGFGGIEKYY